MQAADANRNEDDEDADENNDDDENNDEQDENEPTDSTNDANIGHHEIDYVNESKQSDSKRNKESNGKSRVFAFTQNKQD